MSVDGNASKVRSHPSGYAGIVTRAVALMIDAVVLDVIAVVVAAAAQLLISLLTGDKKLGISAALVTGILWFVWAGLYFTTFWNLTGVTPGNRVLGIRVTTVDGGDVSAWQAVRRYFGLVLAALPLGLGFVPVLFNDRKRGLQDWMGGTVVRWVEHQRPARGHHVPAATPPGERALTPGTSSLPASLPPSES